MVGTHKIFYNGTRVLYPSTFLTCTYFEYSSTLKIKVLIYVLEYLEQVPVPNNDVHCTVYSRKVYCAEYMYTLMHLKNSYSTA